MEKGGYVYFMTNKSNRVLYVGVTNNLSRRIGEHEQGRGSAFTNKYNCTKLVYFEVFPDIEQATVREKQIKHYKREWKDNLVDKMNPEWRDLATEITGVTGFTTEPLRTRLAEPPAPVRNNPVL